MESPAKNEPIEKQTIFNVCCQCARPKVTVRYESSNRSLLYGPCGTCGKRLRQATINAFRSGE